MHPRPCKEKTRERSIDHTPVASMPAPGSGGGTADLRLSRDPAPGSEEADIGAPSALSASISRIVIPARVESVRTL